MANSIGGDAKTCIIICASNHESNRAMTHSTLVFGETAQRVKNTRLCMNGHQMELDELEVECHLEHRYQNFNGPFLATVADCKLKVGKK